jgi:hypothetical protein
VTALTERDWPGMPDVPLPFGSPRLPLSVNASELRG